MCTAGLAAGGIYGKRNGQILARSDGLKWHSYTISKDPGRKHPLVWVALKDKGRAVPDDIACKNAWKALGKGLPGELSTATIKKVLELGRRNAAARACDTSASTSASASASASTPPASTISAPTAVKGKGKRPAAEEKAAAAAALASIGFDTSVPVGELPLATKRTMMATAKTVIEYFGTTSARGVESIDLRSSTNGSIIHLARVSQPRDADVVVSSKTQLRRGRDVMGAVDCAGGGSSNRAGTLAAAGRVDRPSFTQAAGVLGIVTCTQLDPKKTLEMFVSVGFITYRQFRLLKSIMGIRGKDSRSRKGAISGRVPVLLPSRAFSYICVY